MVISGIMFVLCLAVFLLGFADVRGEIVHRQGAAVAILFVGTFLYQVLTEIRDAIRKQTIKSDGKG